MKRIIVGVAFIFFMLFAVKTANAADLTGGDQMSEDVSRFVWEEGKLVGIDHDVNFDHILFVEVRDWTFAIRNNTIIWGVPSTGGKFIPTEQIIHFSEFDWDYKPVIGSEDNMNAEVEFLYWAQWNEPEPNTETESMPTGDPVG